MPRTGVAAAINATIVPTVVYGPDPRGWSWFNRLSGVLQDGISGRAGRRVVDTQATFTGTTLAPQSFAGLAPLGLAAPMTAATSNLSDERAAGVLDNGALRIFAERLKRQR